MLAMDQSVASGVPLDQVDDERDGEHCITDGLNLAIADHQSTESLQETCDCLGWDGWRSKRQIEQSHEPHFGIAVHLEDGDRPAGLATFTLNYLGL